MWEAFCALNPYTLNFKRSEIQKWLVDRQINCTHIDPDTGAQTNQLVVMVNKCKRYAERLMRANTLADGIRNNYEGKLLAMCVQYDFKETAKRMGHAHFTAHTPYILPGWSADKDDTHAAGGYCILITTMNLALNLARAQHWFAGNVTMALDHTFKVIPSIFVCHCPLFAALFAKDPQDVSVIPSSKGNQYFPTHGQIKNANLVQVDTTGMFARSTAAQSRWLC